MASNEISKDGSSKYCLQFGFKAVDMGFITETQMNQALHVQRSGKVVAGRLRLLPTILFDQGWMTSPQIEEVLNAIQKKPPFDE